MEQSVNEVSLRMELIYNELSSIPESSNNAVGDERVVQFIRTYVAASRSGYKAIRFCVDLTEIFVAEGYSMHDWLSATSLRNYKELLLAARRYPFIRDEDLLAQEEYLTFRYFFEDLSSGIAKTECVGLAAADIYSTVAISLASSPAWERNKLDVLKVNDLDGYEDTATVVNVFSENCFETSPVSSFIEESSELELVLTDQLPESKPIHFRDDHGTDVLRAFALRIRQSPYVTAIINSIEWQPRCTRFVFRVFPNGVVHLVLHWTDRGLGIAIQTTGRTLRETTAIAGLLQDEYDS